MGVTRNGIGVQCYGLVVPVRTGIIVDLHGSSFTVNVIVIHTHYRCVIDIAVILSVQKAGGTELLVQSVPKYKARHHIGLTRLVVLDTVIILGSHVTVPAVLDTLHGEIGIGGLIGNETALMVLPYGR